MPLTKPLIYKTKLPWFTASYSKYNCYLFCGKEIKSDYNGLASLCDKSKFKHSYLIC